MLTSIRTVFAKGIARWILIGLVGLLIISFGIWGIQDIFRGFRDTEVARIGDTVIHVETFQRQYNQQVQDLSRQIGQPLTAEQARLFGVEKQVLGRLVTDAALDERAKAYKIGLPLNKIAAMVMEDPAFQAGSGRFNRDYFNAILRQNGLTEAGFFTRQRDAYRRAQIGEAIAGEAAIPLVLRQSLARFSSETRSIDFITLSDATLPSIPEPSVEALTTFFEAHKAEFRAPEYRKFTYMTLSPAEIAKTMTVTDDDAKTDYEARKERFTTPEKREVQQIAFQNAEDAKAAAARLASNAVTFDALMTERKLSPADVSLGTVAKSEMLDTAIADEAFKLTANTPSGVVTGKLTTVILRVTKIEPEIVKSFDSVKDQIKTEVAESRARKAILDIQGKIEDARAGGATLKEIAPKFSLTAVEVASGDATGLDPAGQSLNVPTEGDLLRRVFSTDAGTETDAIDARDAGFIWYEVASITAARDRTLDEAKAAVTAAYVADEKAKALRARADDIVKQAKGGKAFEDLAKEAGVEIKQAWNLKRGEASQGLSTDAVASVFATTQNGYATAPGDTASERLVFKMTGSTVPEFDPKAPQAVALEKQLVPQIGQDILNQYVLRSQTDLGLTTNQTLINQAIGAQN